MAETNGTADIFEMILHADPNEPALIKARPKKVERSWQLPEEEGQLIVDVLEQNNSMYIISPMAGADSERIEVMIHNDLVTIRGIRRRPIDDDNIVHHSECFWGKFSRTIVLPVDVKPDGAWAEYKNGVLVVRIPKRKTDATIPVMVVDE